MNVSSKKKEWMVDIFDYLTKVTSQKMEAKVLRTKEARYVIIVEYLYRRGFSTPILKCLTQN